MTRLLFKKHKVLDSRDVDFKELISIVDSLRDNCLITCRHKERGKEEEIKGAKPFDVKIYLEQFFEPFEYSDDSLIETHCAGKYEVVLEGSTERHKIDVWKSRLVVSVGDEKKFGEPYRQASLEFYINR